MKREFDIKYRPEIESGKYSVVTRAGRKVRIICWDINNDQPIIGLISCKYKDNMCDFVAQFCTNGNYWPNGSNSDNDLFILTDEPELTKFEKHVQAVMENSGLIGCRDKYKDINCVKATSASLLEIAFKELEKICKTQNAPNWYKEAIVNAMEIGKEEAINALPKWRKADWEGFSSMQYRVFLTEEGPILYDQIRHKEINISDLEKLLMED